MGTLPAAPDARLSTDRDPAPLLFCPFCRECYEGEAVCPVHELPLVDFSDLPRQAHERVTRWDEPVVPWEPRFGRGWIVTGSILLLVGFLMPVLVARFDDDTLSWTGYAVAMGPAKNLWTVAFISVMFFYFLYRRRTPMQMVGTRLAAMLLALMPVVSLVYSIFMVQRGAERLHGAVATELGAGVWVIGAGSLCLLVGGFKFGRVAGVDRDRIPHGADLEDDESHGIDAHDDAGRPRKKPRRRRR